MKDTASDDFLPKRNVPSSITQPPYGLPTPAASFTSQPSWSFSQAQVSSITTTGTPSKDKNKRTVSDLEQDATNSRNVPTHHTSPQILRRNRRRLTDLHPLWSPYLSPKSIQSRPQPLNAPFNIFTSIIRHPNLFFQFAMRLPPQTFMDLYAISKEFHYRANKYSVSIVHDYAHYHAPGSAFVFSWLLFPELCISDPILKPMDGRPHLARDIPSFRWVKLVLWRDAIVDEILTRLAMEGHRVPRGMNMVLMKYWVLMELSSQATRNIFIRDTRIWRDKDIMLFQLFVVKLDMRFACPIEGQGICELSHMLLMQKSLTTLRNVLVGKELTTYDEVYEMVIHTYPTADLDTDNHPWLADEIENGVPEEYWGILSKEGWNPTVDFTENIRLESALDLVIKEGIRRGLRIGKDLLDYVMYGYVDPDTGENIPIPKVHGVDKELMVPKEGWPLEKERVATIQRLDKLWLEEKKPERKKTLLKLMREDPLPEPNRDPSLHPIPPMPPVASHCITQ
ncbi:hypothetical protein K469DRAFT_715936 [Zopfia rhizophila CBS 207.26]|uniref:Uncharacterized protein n=1 Tax=Zopfia rhizophila CBS 207.26 TaxID=1314779 RepID=A0A6A6DN81_9PEZI|nr:hypothetical protein K469DRAFT_715936 [Zopfia rhizophila CBS 207.26]